MSDTLARRTRMIFSYPAALALEGLIAFCLLVFWGSTIFSGKITSFQPMSAVETRVLSTLDQSQYPRQDRGVLERFYSLDSNLFLDASVFRSSNAMSARELVLVQFDDAQAAKAFEKAMNGRRDSQSQIFAGYAPQEAALAENALLDVQGNFALFYIGDNPQSVDALFLESLRAQ